LNCNSFRCHCRILNLRASQNVTSDMLLFSTYRHLNQGGLPSKSAPWWTSYSPVWTFKIQRIRNMRSILRVRRHCTYNGITFHFQNQAWCDSSRNRKIYLSFCFENSMIEFCYSCPEGVFSPNAGRISSIRSEPNAGHPIKVQHHPCLSSCRPDSPLCLMSTSHHIFWSRVSLDSGTTRYTTTFVRIFKCGSDGGCDRTRHLLERQNHGSAKTSQIVDKCSSSKSSRFKDFRLDPDQSNWTELQSAKHRRWGYFLTGNESPFCFTIDQDNLWISDG
jgi:hypothetical protein